VLLLRPPGVYRVDRDSTLLAQVLREDGRARGRDVLDVGTGTGVLALTASRAGARSVTAVDLSLRSAVATWLNCRIHRAPVTVRRGDLFEPVRGRRFDLVVANPPYVPSRGGPARHRAGRCWDGGPDGRLLLDRVCAGLPDVLSAQGSALMVHSGVCDEGRTLARLAEVGLVGRVVARAVVPFGPVMRSRSQLLEVRGLISSGQCAEEIVVVEVGRG
jgi:release factor glutamine methyltransferase